MINLDAERALLGALLARPNRLVDIHVTPADMDPAHGHDLILAALLNVWERDGTADHILVAQELHKRGEHMRVGAGAERSGLYLHTLMQAVPTAANMDHYARLVREATARRRLAYMGSQLVQAAERPLDHEALLDAAAQVSIGLSALVDDPDDDAPVAGLSTLESFMAESDTRYEWVIPGLLERQDRFMLVAAEGAGSQPCPASWGDAGIRPAPVRPSRAHPVAADPCRGPREPAFPGAPADPCVASDSG